MNKLQVLQKRAIRTVTLANYRSSTSPLFAKLNILKLHDIVTLNVASFTYRCRNSLLPSQFEDFYVSNQSVHNYNTRHASDIRTNHFRTSQYKRSLRYRSTQIWNKLPNKLKFCRTVVSFRKSVTKYLKCNY